jgi:photosystem II stability/assembly factor-like uncharacterized protein
MDERVKRLLEKVKKGHIDGCTIHLKGNIDLSMAIVGDGGLLAVYYSQDRSSAVVIRGNHRASYLWIKDIEKREYGLVAIKFLQPPKVYSLGENTLIIVGKKKLIAGKGGHILKKTFDEEIIGINKKGTYLIILLSNGKEARIKIEN